jgi:hypothetical protein
MLGRLVVLRVAASTLGKRRLRGRGVRVLGERTLEVRDPI